MAKFTCNFISYTLQRTVDITVIVPSVTIPESMGMGAEGEKPALTHRKADKFPVLYLLHGFGNNHTAWNAYTNVELYAEERQIAVVCLSAENKAYVDQPRDKFYDFVAKELPDFVLGMFPVSDRPEDTYIAGLSMGGYGALVHGLSRSARFAAIVATQLMLAIQAEGLGTTWVGWFDPDAVRAAFPETQGYDLIALFPIGYPAADAQPSPRHFERRSEEEAVARL